MLSKKEPSTKYVKTMKERLKKAYELASRATRTAQERQKCENDKKVQGAILQPGDRVVVKIVAFDEFNCVFVVVGLRRFLLWLSKSLPFGCRVSPIRFLRILIFRQESDWQKEVSVQCSLPSFPIKYKEPFCNPATE
jgi:hypothetical protein